MQIFTYFGYGDLLSKLGGVKSALGPAFTFLIPLFALLFLVKIAIIIKERLKE